jgi:hypothetical protein
MSRNRNLLLNDTVTLVTEECCNCGVLFAMPTELQDRFRANHDKWFYCPNGHQQHYTGPTAEQKLKDAQARETHLKDQLEAAGREAETVRVALLRDRQRFANGVCPCCNRYFPKVHQHMTTQHPDYDVTRVVQPSSTKFACSCGRRFDTLRGLRTHQGHLRGDDWAKPETPRTRTWGGAHLTVV